MPTQPEDRRRLAELMEERRLDLGLHWQDVAAAGNVSLRAVNNARTGSQEMQPLTRRGIDKGLRWRPGSVDQVLMGGYPVPLEDSPARRRDEAPLFAGDVDEAELRPYLRDVEAEIAAAGEGTPGSEVFGNAQEAEIWDNSPWPRGERARAIAVLRMITDEALHPGERRAMLLRITARNVTNRLRRVILLLLPLVPAHTQGRHFRRYPCGRETAQATRGAERKPRNQALGRGTASWRTPHATVPPTPVSRES